MPQYVDKFNFSVKSTSVDNSLHIFSQMNTTFSDTLYRLERENSVLKPHRRAMRLEIKNVGMKLRVYE
jgi:hypothetical protein